MIQKFFGNLNKNNFLNLDKKRWNFYLDLSQYLSIFMVSNSMKFWLFFTKNTFIQMYVLPVYIHGLDSVVAVSRQSYHLPYLYNLSILHNN